MSHASGTKGSDIQAMSHPGAERIRHTISGKIYCGGTRKISVEDSILFYGREDESVARRLNLSNATNEQLADLTKACKPASFGRDGKDVLDKSYRRAGKLDLTEFATTFDLSKTDILDTVASELVEGADELEKVVRADLYKLNVYDEGSFFKAHQDTPRRTNMFASLVIVFATAHAGGSLLFRHKNKEWSFDSAAEVTQSTSSVGFAAFYSDVEHEVTPVTFGHRVTLTYNLYLDNKSPISISNAATRLTDPMYASLRAAFEEALADISFLPDGGIVGFGLNHQYAVRSKNETQDTVKDLVDYLKGSDATLYKVCKDMALAANLRLIYHAEGECHVMMDRFIDVSSCFVDEELIWTILKDAGGKIIWADDWVKEDHGIEVDTVVEWITPQTAFNRIKASYGIAYYGNEPSQEHMYGDLCLIVEVGAFGSRQHSTVVANEFSPMHWDT